MYLSVLTNLTTFVSYLSRKGMDKVKYNNYSFTKTQKNSVSEFGGVFCLLTSRWRLLFAFEVVKLQLITACFVGEQNVSAQLPFIVIS